MRAVVWVCVTAIVLNLLACSSPTPKQDFTDIPDFKSVAIVPTDEIPAITHVKGARERSGDEAKVGVATGGASAALAGGLMCAPVGPFAVVCAILLGGAGMLVGGISGLVIGWSGVSTEHAEQIRESLSLIDQKLDFQQALRNDLEEGVPKQLVADGNFVLYWRSVKLHNPRVSISSISLRSRKSYRFQAESSGVLLITGPDFFSACERCSLVSCPINALKSCELIGQDTRMYLDCWPWA